MAFDPSQISAYQQYINNNYGGGYDANGQWNASLNPLINGSGQFNFDPNNTLVNDQILGKAQQMGFTADQLSQILGGTTAQGIQNYANQNGNGTFSGIYSQIDNADQQHGIVNADGSLNYGGTSGTGGGGTGGGGTGGAGGGAGGSGSGWNFNGIGGIGSPGSSSQYLPPNQNGGYITPASLNAYTRSPALDALNQATQTQFDNNLNQNILPGIRRGSDMVGGVGGSREGIAQGLGIAQSNQGLAAALAGNNYNDYNQQMNRNLQQYQGDQQFNTAQGQLGEQYWNGANQYNLGLGGLALGNQRNMQDFYSTQRGQDLTSMMDGAYLYGAGTQGPWNSLTDASNIYARYTGLGSGENQTQSAGSGATGTLGGALGGAQLYNYWRS
jgi:hypothetical protein